MGLDDLRERNKPRASPEHYWIYYVGREKVSGRHFQQCHFHPRRNREGLIFQRKVDNRDPQSIEYRKLVDRSWGAGREVADHYEFGRGVQLDLPHLDCSLLINDSLDNEIEIKSWSRWSPLAATRPLVLASPASASFLPSPKSLRCCSANFLLQICPCLRVHQKLSLRRSFSYRCSWVVSCFFSSCWPAQWFSLI